MTKRVLLTLALTLIAVAGVIICVASLSKERTFNGRPESYWINTLALPVSPTPGEDRRSVNEAWQALGPQAVPILLRALEMKPGPFGKPFNKLWPKLPAALQKFLPNPVNYECLYGNSWSRLAQQKTKVTIPPRLVARALKEQQGWPIHVVPMTALDCLNRVGLTDSGPEKDQSLPLLLVAAEDPRVEVRMSAILCLGHYRDQSNLVIPVLTNALENPYPEVRIRAAMALHRVDPVAAQKGRVADVAYECLKIKPTSGFGTHDSPDLARQFLRVLGKAPDQ